MNATSTSPASDSQPGSQASPQPENPPPPGPPPGPQAAPAQALRRPVEGRMIAGVACGIADYLGADVTVVRLVLTVLAVMGGVGLPVYLAGWLLIPEEGHDQSIVSEFFGSRQARSL